MKTNRRIFLILAATVSIALGAEAQGSNLVANSSFETTAYIVDWPNQYGVWGGDMVEFETAENGISPVAGAKMLRFEGSNKSGHGNTSGSQVCQVLDLSDYTQLIQSGAAVATASAHFNRVSVDTQTDSEFAVRLYAYSGSVSQHGDLKEAIGHLLRRDTILFSDSDVATWETAVVEMILPADTDFLTIEIAANENIYNDSAPPEFDGHYADVVTVSVTPEPTTLCLLALGGLAMLGRRKRGMCK